MKILKTTFTYQTKYKIFERLQNHSEKIQNHSKKIQNHSKIYKIPHFAIHLIAPGRRHVHATSVSQFVDDVLQHRRFVRRYGVNHFVTQFLERFYQHLDVIVYDVQHGKRARSVMVFE